MSPEFAIALHNLGVKPIAAMPPELIQAKSMGHSIYRYCPECDTDRYVTDFAGLRSTKCKECQKPKRACKMCGTKTTKMYCSELCKSRVERYHRQCRVCGAEFLSANTGTVNCPDHRRKR